MVGKYLLLHLLHSLLHRSSIQPSERLKLRKVLDYARRCNLTSVARVKAANPLHYVTKLHPYYPSQHYQKQGLYID